MPDVSNVEIDKIAPNRAFSQLKVSDASPVARSVLSTMHRAANPTMATLQPHQPAPGQRLDRSDRLVGVSRQSILYMP